MEEEYQQPQSIQLNETKEQTIEEQLKEYLDTKQTYFSGVFASFNEPIDSTSFFSDEELTQMVTQLQSQSETENDRKEDFLSEMKKDLDSTITNYNNEMNIYSSVFTYYNKYISWIYNYSQQ